RKATLTSVLARAASGLRMNEHLEADGPDVFHHACMLGLEGIVSKRKDSQYRSGRSPHWIKSKNPNAPTVKRAAQEDWGQCRVEAGCSRLCAYRTSLLVSRASCALWLDIVMQARGRMQTTPRT